MKSKIVPWLLQALQLEADRNARGISEILDSRCLLAQVKQKHRLRVAKHILGILRETEAEQLLQTEDLEFLNRFFSIQPLLKVLPPEQINALQVELALENHNGKDKVVARLDPFCNLELHITKSQESTPRLLQAIEFLIQQARQFPV